MSRIISKVFDASKKIAKSVFRGSPNLITSEDLNRQISALKFQMDSLDDRTCILSDCKISGQTSPSELSVYVEYTYILYKGCQFKPSNTLLGPVLFDKNTPKAYLCLVADTETVTYDSDASHDIAGAKFEDGKSFPAADQEVYKNERLILSNNAQDTVECLGVLAVIEWNDSADPIIRSNCVAKGDSIGLRQSGTVAYLNPSASGKISVGDDYDTALAKINNKYPDDISRTSVGNYFSYSVKNGILYLFPTQNSVKIPLEITGNGAGPTPHIYKSIGIFDNSVLGIFKNTPIYGPVNFNGTLKEKVFLPLKILGTLNYTGVNDDKSFYGDINLAIAGVRKTITSDSGIITDENIESVELVLYTFDSVLNTTSSSATYGKPAGVMSATLNPAMYSIPVFKG